MDGRAPENKKVHAVKHGPDRDCPSLPRFNSLSSTRIRVADVTKTQTLPGYEPSAAQGAELER